jgi:HD superfamily phosphohydrolase
MKLSTINWLSRAIVLPLFIATASIAPASAEQIARSRRIESLPSVTDLNLTIPVPAKSIDSTERQESMSVTPYWSNSRAINGSKTVVKERDRKSKPISRAKRKLATNSIEPIKLEIERSSLPKSALKHIKVVTVNTELSSARTARDSRQTKPDSRRRLAAVSRLSENGNYLKLVQRQILILGWMSFKKPAE